MCVPRAITISSIIEMNSEKAIKLSPRHQDLHLMASSGYLMKQVMTITVP
jgi:hypothetical protein